MDLHIKTKFDIGQEVRLVYKRRKTIANYTPCTFCEGNGFFIYKQERCQCPKCGGKGLRFNEKTVNYYDVHNINWKIVAIKITVNENNNPIISYKLIGFDSYYGRVKELSDEIHLFETYDNAKKYCDEKNNIETGGINNA